MKCQSSLKSRKNLEVGDGQVVVLIQHYSSGGNADSPLSPPPPTHTHTERKIKDVCIHWQAGDALGRILILPVSRVMISSPLPPPNSGLMTLASQIDKSIQNISINVINQRKEKHTHSYVAQRACSR